MVVEPSIQYHFVCPNPHQMHLPILRPLRAGPIKINNSVRSNRMPAWSPAKGKMTLPNGWTYHVGDTRVKLFLMLYFCVSIRVAKAGHTAYDCTHNEWKGDSERHEWHCFRVGKPCSENDSTSTFEYVIFSPHPGSVLLQSANSLFVTVAYERQSMR